MVETECYKELNVFGPCGTPSSDLLLQAVPQPEKKGCFPFSRKKENQDKYNTSSEKESTLVASTEVDQSSMSDTGSLMTSSDLSETFPSSSLSDSEPKKKKVHRESGLLLEMIEKGYNSTPQSQYEILAKMWAMKLQKLDRLQSIFAEKLINDVFFEAEMGSLTHGCHVVARPESHLFKLQDVFQQKNPQDLPHPSGDIDKPQAGVECVQGTSSNKHF